MCEALLQLQSLHHHDDIVTVFIEAGEERNLLHCNSQLLKRVMPPDGDWWGGRQSVHVGDGTSCFQIVQQ